MAADIETLMAIAVGCIGMSLTDFFCCTPSQFWSIYNLWSERETAHERARWERTRRLCHSFLIPYSRHRITPSDVMRFPWDNEKAPSETSDRAMTSEEVRHRFEKIKRERGLR